MIDDASIGCPNPVGTIQPNGHRAKWRQPTVPSRVALLLTLLILAQILVFDHSPGLGLAFFMTVLAGTITILYRDSRSPVLGAAMVAATALIAHSGNLLPIALAAVLLWFYALGRAGALPEGDLQKLANALRIFGIGFFLSVPGIAVSSSVALKTFSETAFWSRAIRRWLFPVLVASIFMVLFLPANPWLAFSVDYLNPHRWLEVPRLTTIVLWVLFGLAIWPALTLHPSNGGAVNEPSSAIARALALIPGSDIASLMLFNGVFLVQTASDAIGLWPHLFDQSGTAPLLPAGISYADFAKAGAYPLLIATLLAAGIIILVLRDQDGRQANRFLAALVVVWVVQTILLLGSAAMRLELYVDAYGLTRLRFYTFAGMALIGVGLLLTIWRIAWARSNAWLTRSCLIALTALFFTLSVFNVDGLIARQNIARVMTKLDANRPVALDIHYLCNLSSGALPEISTALKETVLAQPEHLYLTRCQDALLAELRERQADLRSWTFRGARIVAGVSPRLPQKSTYDKQKSSIHAPDNHGNHSRRR